MSLEDETVGGSILGTRGLTQLENYLYSFEYRARYLPSWKDFKTQLAELGADPSEYRAYWQRLKADWEAFKAGEEEES